MNAAGKLARALTAMADAAGCAVRVVPVSETSWASATFAGALHVLAIEGDGSAAFGAWLDTLGDAELAAREYVAAGVAVERQGNGAQVTALMLETI